MVRVVTGSKNRIAARRLFVPNWTRLGLLKSEAKLHVSQLLYVLIPAGMYKTEYKGVLHE